jgi:hypothetical protein
MVLSKLEARYEFPRSGEEVAPEEGVQGGGRSGGGLGSYRGTGAVGGSIGVAAVVGANAQQRTPFGGV